MTVTQPRPTTAELVAAAREQLAGDDPADERSAYLRRVVVGVLAIVERDLEAAERVRAVEAEECQRLGVTDTDELAAEIRAGRFDERRGELLAALRAITREQLAIDNPRYAAWDDHDPEEPPDGLRHPA